jgi:hypothetical protein
MGDFENRSINEKRRNSAAGQTLPSGNNRNPE